MIYSFIVACGIIFPAKALGQEENISFYQNKNLESKIENKTERKPLFSLKEMKQEQKRKQQAEQEKIIREWEELDKTKIMPLIFSSYAFFDEAFSRYNEEIKRKYSTSFYKKDKGLGIPFKFEF